MLKLQLLLTFILNSPVLKKLGLYIFSRHRICKPYLNRKVSKKQKKNIKNRPGALRGE